MGRRCTLTLKHNIDGDHLALHGILVKTVGDNRIRGEVDPVALQNETERGGIHVAVLPGVKFLGVRRV